MYVYVCVCVCVRMVLYVRMRVWSWFVYAVVSVDLRHDVPVHCIDLTECLRELQGVFDSSTSLTQPARSGTRFPSLSISLLPHLIRVCGSSPADTSGIHVLVALPLVQCSSVLSCIVIPFFQHHVHKINTRTINPFNIHPMHNPSNTHLTHMHTHIHTHHFALPRAST
jgi:hypothetical protein